MFGTNPISKPFQQTDGSLKVNELFYTLQGEGPDAGRPAIFVRLSHCNLRCYFCDTEFETGVFVGQHELLKSVLDLSRLHGCSLVVITGGEPLLQNIVPLVLDLNLHGISVSVETAGTLFDPELPTVFSPTRDIAGNLIVCSPKTPKINSDLEGLVGAWKYIIRHGNVGPGGIPNMSTQQQGTHTNLFMPRDITVPVYVQPMDEGDELKNRLNVEATAQVALRFGHRMSVQIHKLAGLR
jgi:hypothetical protein